jgi:ABC-type glutathione transport system ATPase component
MPMIGLSACNSPWVKALVLVALQVERGHARVVGIVEPFLAAVAALWRACRETWERTLPVEAELRLPGQPHPILTCFPTPVLKGAEIPGSPSVFPPENGSRADLDVFLSQINPVARRICDIGQPEVNEMVQLVFRTEGLRKTYDTGEVQVHALAGVDLELYAGELAVLLGASGSGKSTLLNILGGLDHASAGRVWFRDLELTTSATGR